MQPPILVLSCLAGLACSAAIETRGENWPEPVMEYYEAVSRRLAKAKDDPLPKDASSCLLSNATLPSSSLPMNDTLALYHVAVGRGTQVSPSCHCSLRIIITNTPHRTTPAPHHPQPQSPSAPSQPSLTPPASPPPTKQPSTTSPA